mgnify:CR=1 FL=1
MFGVQLMGNKRLKVSAVIIGIILYCIPVLVICLISDKEVKQYSEDKEFTFRDTVYGRVVSVERKSIKEYYSVNGKIISNKVVTIILPQDNVHICINEGQEILKGDVIAQQGTKNIKSKYNGLISRVEYGDKTIIYIDDFSDLAMECLIPKAKMEKFDTKKFYDKKKRRVQVLKKSNMVEEGFVKILLKIPDKNCLYGQEVQGYKLYTGNQFSNCLVVNKNCVYQKCSDRKWYIRAVTKDGIVIGENEVEIGYENDDYICITGVDSGTYCDDGYKALVEGNIKDETTENTD